MSTQEKKAKRPVGNLFLDYEARFRRKHAKDKKLLREVDFLLNRSSIWYCVVFLNIMAEKDKRVGEADKGSVRQALLSIPHQNAPGWNRYDTDDEHVLHVWADGKSYDIRIPKERLQGAGAGADAMKVQQRFHILRSRNAGRGAASRGE